MPFKVVYSIDQILIDFTLLVVALRHLTVTILWLFLNAVGYLLSMSPALGNGFGNARWTGVSWELAIMSYCLCVSIVPVP